jgi:hypothetical protein
VGAVGGVGGAPHRSVAKRRYLRTGMSVRCAKILLAGRLVIA